MIVLIVSGHTVYWALMFLSMLICLVKGSQAFARPRYRAFLTAPENRRDLVIGVVLLLAAMVLAGWSAYQLLAS